MDAGKQYNIHVCQVLCEIGRVRTDSEGGVLAIIDISYGLGAL